MLAAETHVGENGRRGTGAWSWTSLGSVTRCRILAVVGSCQMLASVFEVAVDG